ncbi:MAG: putative DNA modification/repair radical SAM protein [Coriobacteriia bacterium]|nr:putative DNA modification/repair radical SAM protein [Coriobacteriia bacterium]
MDLTQKLEILADAAKYDVACTSSGAQRQAELGKLGSASCAGCCHSFTPDGRCISLLKVLLTNACVYDCAYCVNRCSNDVPRAAFTPQELAELTIGFYRRNYIEGLFLSSGVIKSPDYTTELMIKALSLLRNEYGFRGYIHAKGVPGTSPALIDQLGRLVDRLSVNMELPSQESLQLLAPGKTRQNILAPMKQIQESIAADAETNALMRRKNHYLTHVAVPKKQRAFAPAGQSTQMIIGATPENDYQILTLSASLYSQLQLKRVFFSAYIPATTNPLLPQGANVQLNREHRLYQADWLLRFYEFNANEIIDTAHPYLDLDLDPKANWAINNLDSFPVEVNTAPYEMLLRVPGIGVVGAKKICKARKHRALCEQELRKIGVAFKRARYFITCNGKYQGTGARFEPGSIRARLAAPIDGGKHGRRAGNVCFGQMSLFDQEQPTALPGGPEAAAAFALQEQAKAKRGLLAEKASA